VITCHRKFFEARCRQRGYSLADAMPCVVAKDGDQWTIDEKHSSYPGRRRAVSAPPDVGPGTELKKLLATIGIHASKTCKCNAMANKMNKWGQESLNHTDEIVAVMEETAQKRKLPFSRLAAKALVRLACWRARKGNGS
jgi:hypothetical protein